MRVRSLAITPPPRTRTRGAEIQTLAAIVRYQEWDREMVRLHGPLYHRELGYTLH
ncbi:MAG: hypothetical protein JWR80_4815 [Bradyrhizobium sp.]|nr:hypothetical protein [Bradyrhizobium sp.]